jgi:hypothetical protein
MRWWRGSKSRGAEARAEQVEVRRVVFPRTSAGFALAFASLTDAVVMVGPEGDDAFPHDRLWIVPRADAEALEDAGFLRVPAPADEDVP